MTLRVVSNVAAINAHRSLLRNDGAGTLALERLSSGIRINRAADDAAGLGISEGLRSQVGGLDQALRNTQDGINLIRTAEGALTETTALLQRMRDLVVQGVNDGAMGPTAKDAVQVELEEVKEALDRIAATTSFNGIKLLDGHYRGTLQVGARADETLTVAIGGPGDGMSAEELGVAHIAVSANSERLPPPPPTVTRAVSDEEGTATSSRMSFSGDFITPGVLEDSYARLTGTISYNGRVFDLDSVDYTGDVTAQDYIDTINQAARAALGTTGMPVVATSGQLLLTGANPGAGSTVADATRLSLRYSLGHGLGAIDLAIRHVSTVRAGLGASENRLAHTAASLAVAAENSSASLSRIRDTDMAEEMVRFTRSQVLSQAATAMLAQANQSPQGILRLLN
ncbi:flagellin [Blastococcus sp. TF02A_35]|uniref:flagellin N-terminal helical domain-containing protein n=1 Tax=Blastococcus sp. TF02A-35 TaxID=2559612 RepID=UPI0010748F72|nr:flagellin [Blastococcus sp. TF02A_35]TFV51919.1 flagellin [Blastococcus sp. TF02A_35]